MDGRRFVRAVARGVGAAVVGGLVGAVLTRGLMRLIMIVAGGDTSFTWAGIAFIALFYVVFLTPGAIALAWSAARWPLFLFGAGALAIPVQATGIATTDLEAVGPAQCRAVGAARAAVRRDGGRLRAAGRDRIPRGAVRQARCGG